MKISVVISRDRGKYFKNDNEVIIPFDLELGESVIRGLGAHFSSFNGKLTDTLQKITGGKETSYFRIQDICNLINSDKYYEVRGELIKEATSIYKSAMGEYDSLHYLRV